MRNQAPEIIRGCRGLDLVGCDLVRVAPIYDTPARRPASTADCSPLSTLSTTRSFSSGLFFDALAIAHLPGSRLKPQPVQQTMTRDM